MQTLADDLNTPIAITLVGQILQSIEKSGLSDSTIAQFTDMLSFIDSVLGTKLASTQDITADQKALVAERTAARAAKDFARADQLRILLLDQGIEVSDTASGPRWMRTDY